MREEMIKDADYAKSEFQKLEGDLQHLGAKQESFVDSHQEFKETTRQKLASLELNSNWEGSLTGLVSDWITSSIGKL